MDTLCSECGEKYPVTEMTEHFNENLYCSHCSKYYFKCPECGVLYDRKDIKHGDFGSGYCADCSAVRRLMGED